MWHACRVNQLQAVPQIASKIVDFLAVSEYKLFSAFSDVLGVWTARMLNGYRDILDALDTVDTPAKVAYPGYSKFGFPKIVQAQRKKDANSYNSGYSLVVTYLATDHPYVA